ncbi:MAG: TetR family transcriptional regulator [Deltaproteobacteria bacterium]|nr:TetR family transcriptional regulator [Deltaproteobacteria bacterium]
MRRQTNERNWWIQRAGYSSTSLDDVAKELGISKAALYHYVSSKDKLLSTIYTQAFESIFRDTYEISGMDLPPDEKLRRIIGNHIHNIIIKNLSMFSVFFSEENQLPEKDFRKIRDEKKKYTRIIEDIVTEGISKGLFKKVDPKLQAYAILGMCNWVFKWYRPDRDTHSPDAIADHFMTLLESGYLADDRGPVSSGAEIGHGKGEKEKSVSAEAVVMELRRQCHALSDLADRLEAEKPWKA